MLNYLHIALWIVFFYDAIVMLLLPSSVQFILGTDGSAARYIVNVISLAISALVLLTVGFKKIDNKWIAVFSIVIVISHFHSPNINFGSEFLPKDMAIYNYKPMFELLVFFLLFLAVSSIDFTQNALYKIYRAICWIAITYSVYMIFQKLGMDQFYKITSDQTYDHLSRSPEVGGFIGQPVFAAAFLAACIPFLIKNSSKISIIIVCLAILLTGNRTACIATIICAMMMFPFYLRIGKITLISYVSILFGAFIFKAIFPAINLHFLENERFAVWAGLFHDFVKPAFPGINAQHILTGHGLGAFPVLFPFYHHSGFYQAHNELFELIYATGILGMIAAYFMCMKFINQIKLSPVTISLLAISICALTNPVWHIPQLAFITVFLLGLAYNNKTGVMNVAI